MATKVFILSPGDSLETVVEGVGGAVQSSEVIALTVDMATNLVTDGSTTRGILKSEVILALETLTQYLVRSNWPPA